VPLYEEAGRPTEFFAAAACSNPKWVGNRRIHSLESFGLEGISCSNVWQFKTVMYVSFSFSSSHSSYSFRNA
jgi:hypothetical protein